MVGVMAYVLRAPNSRNSFAALVLGRSVRSHTEGYGNSPILWDNVVMAESDWTFWVSLVKDGAREGLLIGRRERPAGRAEHAYFFMLNPEGLAHNEQLVRLCKSRICPIDGRYGDENRIFELLRECAAFAAAQPTPPTEIPIEKVFHNRQESPAKVLPRLFEAAGTGKLRNPNSKLRDFLVDWATFRRVFCF